MMIPRVLWKIWFLLNFIFTLILLYPIFLILLSNRSWFGAAFVLMRFWAHWLAYGSGIFLSIKKEIGTNEIPSPCIFVSNHCSYLDIILSYIIIPRYFSFVGKQELDKAPLFRIFFKRMNILVNRSSTVGSHRAFMRVGEEIDKGHSVFIFPEATIASKGMLLPFKNGAFRMAIEKQVPIVPIVYENNWRILQNGGFFTSTGKPGIVKAIFCKPVFTKGMTSADLISLRENVRNNIKQRLGQKEQ